ncbi:MAG: efflux RND transporter permease subunit, partial [bacterium]
ADGEKAILLTVLKTSGADSISIIKEIRKKAQAVEKNLPDTVKINFSNDTSLFIKDRLDVVFQNGGAGALLVLAVLLLMLRPSVAFLTALGLPVAFGLSLLVIKMLGISYDMLSLFGYVMVLGMIVDNAIVVGENVYRHLEEGKLPKQAAVEGSAEMIVPVTASVATTVAAFFPLLMVGGVLGGFLAPIPTAIIITIIASYAQCYLVLPSHLSDFAKCGPKTKLTVFQDSLTMKIRRIYGKLLRKVMDRRRLFLSVFIILFAGSVMLGLMRGIEFFNTETDQISIKIKTETTNSLSDTRKITDSIEKKILEVLDPRDLDSIYSYVGIHPGTQGNDEISSNLAYMDIFLKIKTERKTKDSEALINTVRETIGRPEGVIEIKTAGVSREGGPGRNDIEFVITGGSYENLKKAADEITNAVSGIEGIVNIYPDIEQGKKEIRIILDEKKANAAGAPLSDIAMILRAAVAGAKVDSIKRGGEDIDIIVRAKKDDIKNIDDLLSYTAPNRMGSRIPLNILAKTETGYSYTVLKHTGGRKSVSIIGEIDKNTTTVSEANGKILKEIESILKKYSGVEVLSKGEYREMQQRFRDLGFAFLAAMFLIFIILAALFNSLTQPFIIMLAIPFGFMGVMLALFLHGMPVSFGAFMGFVGLSGVVVNNSLIFTDFINKQRRSGKSMEMSVLKAAKTRVRPIILTTLTTAAGLLPMGYGLFGANDAFLQPVAIVFAWGLLFSAVVTLFIIPVFTVMVHNAKIMVFKRLGRKLSEEYAFVNRTKKNNKNA